MTSQHAMANSHNAAAIHHLTYLLLHSSSFTCSLNLQLETKDPEPTSFLYTRSSLPYKGTHATVHRDPCNHPERFHKQDPDTLWPNLLTEAKQPSCKPPVSNIALGDPRVDPFKTSYGVDFTAPFSDTARLRSPNRNEDLSKTTASLRDIYRSSFNRVGDKRLQKMIATMRERMDAKCGNCNDNAFRCVCARWGAGGQ